MTFNEFELAMKRISGAFRLTFEKKELTEWYQILFGVPSATFTTAVEIFCRNRESLLAGDNVGAMLAEIAKHLPSEERPLDPRAERALKATEQGGDREQELRAEIKRRLHTRYGGDNPAGLRPSEVLAGMVEDGWFKPLSPLSSKKPKARLGERYRPLSALSMTAVTKIDEGKREQQRGELAEKYGEG